jgi:competence protein ComFA
MFLAKIQIFWLLGRTLCFPFLLYIDMATDYICPLCGNADPLYIGHLNGKPYCRKCICFRGDPVQKSVSSPKNVVLELQYHLTEEQSRLSAQIVENFKNRINTLCWAVCGSGKTEISYGVLAYAMSRGLKCGFALPRRDVVIELYFRIKSAFPSNTVVAVYGQHTSKLEGDVVILTTHQLYRYRDYFDLLVMDEIDAFPYKGNETLISFFKASLKGNCLMMSATPSEAIKKEFRKPNHSIIELRTRFHKNPIPVPKTIIRYGFFKYLFLVNKLRYYRKKGLQCFVFVPTISLAQSVFEIVSVFVPNGNYVSSKRFDREKIIDLFRSGFYRFLITTAVLERGVTVRNIQVVILMADHSIYDGSSLIQISGRAGRKSDAPKGDVFFVVDKVTKPIKKAIAEIEFCNTFL